MYTPGGACRAIKGICLWQVREGHGGAAAQGDRALFRAEKKEGSRAGIFLPPGLSSAGCCPPEAGEWGATRQADGLAAL